MPLVLIRGNAMTPTIIMSEEPSDTDAVLSGLLFNVNWLIELSNEQPSSFIGRELELYQAMNALQLVLGRFVRPTIAPVSRSEREAVTGWRR